MLRSSCGVHAPTARRIRAAGRPSRCSSAPIVGIAVVAGNSLERNATVAGTNSVSPAVARRGSSGTGGAATRDSSHASARRLRTRRTNAGSCALDMKRPSGVTGDRDARLHVVSDDRTSADDGAVADRDPHPDDRPGADPHVVADADRPEPLAGFL